MFIKTDLAKFENAWNDCPHIVSTGAQKNFVKFAEEIGKLWDKDDKLFNELYFKHLVAKAIVFRTTEKLVTKQSWYDGGYRANIVVYSIAWIANKVSELNKAVNFNKIWERQVISDAMCLQLEEVAKTVNDVIIDTPSGTSNVTEWCKKLGCWTKVKPLDIGLSDEFEAELITLAELKRDNKQAKKIQKIDNGIKGQEKVFAISAQSWKEALEWGKKNNLLSPKDISIMSVATRIPDSVPSEKQCDYILKISVRLEEEGFKFS